MHVNMSLLQIRDELDFNGIRVYPDARLDDDDDMVADTKDLHVRCYLAL